MTDPLKQDGHPYVRAQQSADKTMQLLALAAIEARTGLAASVASGIVSPTPALHQLLLNAVLVAHDSAQAIVQGSRFKQPLGGSE